MIQLARDRDTRKAMLGSWLGQRAVNAMKEFDSRPKAKPPKRGAKPPRRFYPRGRRR